MKFLIDAQLPPALCGWLRERGHEADHVFDLGLMSASDDEIAARAESEAMVLISKDEDFLTLRLHHRFAFVWLRCGNATNSALTAWLDPRWEQIETWLSNGEALVEVQ